MSTAYLKWGAVISFIVGMSVLLWGGRYIRQSLPPYPQQDKKKQNKQKNKKSKAGA